MTQSKQANGTNQSGLLSSNKDVWSSRGCNGVWKREHRGSRRALFTPCRVARGPCADKQLIKIRKTSGVDINSMRQFKVIDDWTQSSNAHRILPFTWIGRTTFHEVTECLEDMADLQGISPIVEYNSSESHAGGASHDEERKEPAGLEREATLDDDALRCRIIGGSRPSAPPRARGPPRREALLARIARGTRRGVRAFIRLVISILQSVPNSAGQQATAASVQ